MRLLNMVFILVVIFYFTPEIEAKTNILNKIFVKEEPFTTSTPETNPNQIKNDLKSFASFEPNSHAEIKPENHLEEHKNATASNGNISCQFEMTCNKSEPFEINLDPKNLGEPSKLSMEITEDIKLPKKFRKKGDNESKASEKLPIITIPDVVIEQNHKHAIKNSIRNDSIEPNQMQSQVSETVYIPDVHYDANINGASENYGINNFQGHDLTFLLDDKLNINHASHNPQLPTLPTYNPHFFTPHLTPYQMHPLKIYKNTPNSLTIPSHGSLFSHYPYRTSVHKFHPYYPPPYHRGYGYLRYKHSGGRLSLSAHGYGYIAPGDAFGQRPSVVYMYPYYPPAKEKLPIVGFSDWREKPIKEEIEGDIMYDFRTKTHSIE